MQIVNSFSQYVIFGEDSILTALNKISQNKRRLIFVVSESGILLGILTDGDFRRWIATALVPDLGLPVTVAMNPSCQSASSSCSHEKLATLFEAGLDAIPLLDSNQRITAIAFPGKRDLAIAGRPISEQDPVFIIAEIGNNHNGSIELAFQLIDMAASAGADCAKFQMRDMAGLYVNQGRSDDLASDLGTQYTLDLLERFQLSDDDLYRCFDRVASKGMIPLCTPWDSSSLDKLHAYGLPGFKVASADFTNHALLKEIASTGKPLIASTGMATELEIKSGAALLDGCSTPFALLHCNSTYPTPFKDVNLRYLQRLREICDAPVGYSGHERGYHVPVAAVGLGACVVEKHLTLDRSMEGNDHKVSLLPDEFRAMVESIRQVEESLGSAKERTMSQGEMMNREVLGKSLVATVPIPAGTTLTRDMVGIRSPGQGLPPYRIDDLLGVKLEVSKNPGDFFFESDLSSEAVKPRSYSFQNPFGVPVRYHDIDFFLGASNLDLVEIHLSYKDLDADFTRLVAPTNACGLVVHAPELFAGDHTLDLCIDDQSYREHSIRELQRVVDISRALRERFVCPNDVLLVTNVGGFSESAHLAESRRAAMKDLLVESLGCLNLSGVELIPQTMPPFPWHFGGQRFHNLFVDAQFIDEFCRQTGFRVCLDVSHSKLACNHLKFPFSRFLEIVLPHTAHLHLADAAGVDGEGLQIGDGDVDWHQFFEQLAIHAPNASFIPEIWQGHKNQGEGAWLSLQRLETFHLQAREQPAFAGKI